MCCDVSGMRCFWRVYIDLAAGRARGGRTDNHNRRFPPRRGFAVFPTPSAPTPFDLHWRLFGIDFRVHPSFWLVNLLFGYFYVRYVPDADNRLLPYLGLWLLCAFVSILVHELGHVTAGRLFG